MTEIPHKKMYRIRKPTTNYENIPVSSMEGPSSPTSITFWNRESNLCHKNNEITIRKKINVEKGNSNKNLIPRVKQTVHKCALAGGHLINNKDFFLKRNSRPLIDHSRPTSPPSVRYDGSKTNERQIKDNRKVIAYLKPSANACPNRGKKHIESGISLSSTGANIKISSHLQNMNVPLDFSDQSRDSSTANTCSDLPADGCGAFLNHEGNKKQVSTKDCKCQTSSCLIKNCPPLPDEDCLYKSTVPKKSHRSSTSKSIYSTVWQRPRWQQNNSQLVRNRSQASHSQAASKRKLKIPDHQIIYMDKLDPSGTKFWGQIASEVDKPETHSHGRTKHGQH